MSQAPHAITSLILENFRNYRTLSLQLPPQPVVLRGRNGAGKTNILEAISLLSPGRGLRSARLKEMDYFGINEYSGGAAGLPPLPAGEATRLSASALSRSGEGAHPRTVPKEHEASNDPADGRPHPDFLSAKGALSKSDLSRGRGAPASPLKPYIQPWTVAAHIAARGDTTFIGTGRDGDAPTDKRVIKINGERIKGHAALAEHACIQWLTPSMDQVFIEGSTARRKLFDRITYGFLPEHANRVTAYETAMRERNRLLSDQRTADPYWLSVLEQQMAEHSVAITLARQEVLAHLQKQLSENIAHFPRAELALTGTIETWLTSGDSALDVESKFAERLKMLRTVDAVRGRASEGPQRSLWDVTHREKATPAANCSTGEQKALLLSIMLAAARARAAWCGTAPILLLDEVIAHLDVDKRAQLFDLIRECRIQAWMTGTDAADFKGLEGFSTILEIDGGTVKM